MVSPLFIRIYPNLSENLRVWGIAQRVLSDCPNNLKKICNLLNRSLYSWYNGGVP